MCIRDRETTIHGHDGEDCWVYLLEGEMAEVFYTLDQDNYVLEIGSQKVMPQQLTFMNDSIGFHKLKNSSNGKSMSLHLYAKPIEYCRSYDEVTGSFIKKQLRYDTLNKLLQSTTI